MCKYFSDREQGIKEQTLEDIPENVWNGIVAIYKKLIADNNLASSFPVECPDDRGVYSCDVKALEHSIKAEIPSIKTPIATTDTYYDSYDFEDEVNNQDINELAEITYTILDFIEFIYSKITDVEKGSYHSFFGHYHLSFPQKKSIRKKYRKDINFLFSNAVTLINHGVGWISLRHPTGHPLLYHQ